jgi:predicted O-methyltransferase YrrM
MIPADNTLRHSALGPDRASGIARFNAMVAAHPRLVSIIVPVLRGYGFDGLLIAVKAA